MIPQNAALPLWLTALFALFALLTWAAKYMHRQHMVLRWDSMYTTQKERARRIQYQLTIVRTLLLAAAAVAAIIFVLVLIVEAPRV